MVVDDLVMPAPVVFRDGTTVDEPDEEDRVSENGSEKLSEGTSLSLTRIAVTSL